MRKLIILLLVTAMMINSVDAQKISADKVPAVVTTTFKTKFPATSKVSWEMENKSLYEANFKLHGVEVSASFDNEGRWLETETEISISALPSSIKSTLKRDFVDFKINEGSKIESAKIGKYYEAEIEKGGEKFDILFSADGKVISNSKIEEMEKEDK